VKGFLFDENLPRRLVFKPSLPIVHASSLGTHPTDDQLWEHDRNNELVIVTKDADFSGRVILASPPSWVIHLRFGNLRLKQYHAFLKRVWPRIDAMLPEHKLINVMLDSIEGVAY
jgi:predicted nuclease of predicted toxin-antitoxin system